MSTGLLLFDPKTVVALILPIVTFFIVKLVYHRKRGVKFYENGREVDITPVEEPFDWKTQEPKPYRPFKKGKYNMTMGLKKVVANDWLLMENTYDGITDLRGEIVDNFPKNTVLTEPMAREAVHEIYDMMIGFMVKKYGKYFEVKGRMVHNHVKGTELPLLAEYFPKGTHEKDIIKLLARNVEEDFLLLLWDDEQEMYFLRSGSFAFPSGFDPAIKLNMALRDIHGPVPMYKEKLDFPMDRFFAKLKVGQWVERANWAIQTHEKLYAPLENHSSADVILEPLKAADLDFDKVYMRTERQWLTRLPKSQAIVFTIRTYKTPLSKIKGEGRGLDFVDAINALPDNVAQYKKRPEWGNAVTEYLSA